MHKNMKDKVRRKRVNWLHELINLGNPELERQFILRLGKLRRGKTMSARRCAFYTLKKYYSTTTIDDLWSKLYELH